MILKLFNTNGWSAFAALPHLNLKQAYLLKIRFQQYIYSTKFTLRQFRNLYKMGAFFSLISCRLAEIPSLATLHVCGLQCSSVFCSITVQQMTRTNFRMESCRKMIFPCRSTSHKVTRFLTRVVGKTCITNIAKSHPVFDSYL